MIRHKKRIITLLTIVALVVSVVWSAVGGLNQPEVAYARTIETRDEMGAGNKMHFYMSDTGVLSWDAVPGAAKYSFRSYWMPGNFEDWSWQVEGTSYDIIGKYDELKRDTHQYRFEVTALNESGTAISGYTDYISYYYISPYLELGMPVNLRWDGKIARWDAVDGATEGYKVSLYDADGGAVGSSQYTTNTYYDFSASVQNGYHFKVSTNKTATNRGSNVNDSERYGEYSLAWDRSGAQGLINFHMSNGGNLEWDEVPSATGYTIQTYYWPGDFGDITKDLSYNEYNLLSDFNNRKMDTGWYRVRVTAKGVLGYDDTFMYYYVSPYDKLATPTNLRWDGKTAKWDAVTDAYEGYTVHLYNLAGETIETCYTHDTYCDFYETHYEDGWTFEVKAKTTASSRGSDAVTSLQYERPVWLIDPGVYDATVGDYNRGGEILVETDHGGCTKGYGCYAQATDETEVTMTAYPDAGYRFVAWKIGNWNGQTLSTNPVYTFNADSNIRIMAVFRDESEVHTVTFDSHGGSAVPTQTVPYGMPATEPEPTWEGHVFQGWYTEAGYENRYDFDDNVEADIVLHAKWAIAIPTANILIEEPVAGGNPDFTLVVDGQHFTVEFDNWVLYDSSLDYPHLTPESVFEKGEDYELSYRLLADEGYAFPRNAEYTVNGEHAYRAGGVDETNVYVRYHFDIPDIWEVENWIDSANVIMDEPIVGGHPDFSLVAEGEHYRVEDVSWVRDDGDYYTELYSEDEFEAGYYYEVEYSLYPDDLYGFVDGATYTVNGRAASRAGGDGAAYALVRYRFMMSEEGEELHVDDRTGGIATITKLSDGVKVTAEKPCTVAMSDDGGMTYTRIPAVAVDGEENTYKFSFTVYGNTSAVVAVNGDGDFDREVSTGDSNLINRSLISDTLLPYRPLSVLEAVVLDVDEDGVVSTGDSNLINRSLISDTLLPYRPLSW